MTPQRSAGIALLLLFLAAHLVFLPRTLEDLDSINFALGVRHFDVARHQPHPPGYPVFIALAKVSTAVLRGVGVDSAATRGLAIWSALAGAAALPALLLFFRRLEARSRLAWCATLVVAASPLFWFTALRPLSDMLGFAAVMWVLALTAGSPTIRSLALSGLIAGVAIGIRSQTAVLTLPALGFAIVRRRDLPAALASAAAVSAGALAWGIPLVIASGGVSAYLNALTFQADADLSGGVVNLWTHHSARDVARALLNTFVWPWDRWPGVAMCALAAIGSLRLAWRSWPAATALAIAFMPYAVFHLLFQETVTTRYALPLVPLMAYAAMAALEGLPGAAMTVAAVGVAAISLLTAVPAARHYAREGAPAFRAFDDMATTAHSGERIDAIGFHAGLRRAVEWAEQILPARAAKAPHGREWLTLIELWRAQPEARVWFAADPKRTDLALFDEHARELTRAYRWGFPELPFVGGARPGNVDWYTMQPPNWMLDRGWSVTPEVAGITAKDQLGPHRAPTVAWLKRQPGEVAVILGGRNIGAARMLDVALSGTHIADVPLGQGFFVSHLVLPPGLLAGGPSYQALEVHTSNGEAVTLEQFDAQPAGVPMVSVESGWQEPEFNPETGQSWRWMSERAQVWVRPVGKPVTLRLTGESPARYFDATPHVRIVAGAGGAGDKEILAFDPAADFEQSVTLPADLLAAMNGRISIESTKFFVPAQRGGPPDQRHLALRIYSLHVE